MAELAQKIKCDSRKSNYESKTCKSNFDSRESIHKSNQKSPKSTKESWFERNECAGGFWLNITIWLVRILPRFALNIAVIFVTLIYYMFSKKERKNLAKFYNLAQNHCKAKHIVSQKNAINKPNIYRNFYHFGWAICDKIAVWIGKIRYEHISVDSNLILKEICNVKKGQVLVMSHFGNTEVAYALSQKFHNLRIVIFVYQKNTEKFLQMIDKISKHKIERIYVDDIDIQKLLELREIIDSGGHIGIMGDRVSLNNKRNVAVDFLGKPCYFSLGAFIIAQLLDTKISAMWCEKINGKYRVELDFLGNPNQLKHSRDKVANLKPLVQKYATLLETHALNNPTQWFSFYDFWEEPREMDLHDLDSRANLEMDSNKDSRDLGVNPKSKKIQGI